MSESKEYEWMVSVQCITFNHAPYITDAMNGFCMQETNFPYVCVIVDDCSTDGEQDVIKRYLAEHFEPAEQNIVKDFDTEDYSFSFARHKNNQNCYFAVYYLKYNHYSVKKPKARYLNELPQHTKYIAMCEGDDYWIHPGKLQMQVDFLENHPDYSLVHTDFDLVEGKRRHWKEIFPDGNYFPGIFHNNVNIGTLTTLFRTSTYAILPKLYIGKGWPMNDYPLWLEFAHAAKIYFINIVTARYRVLLHSASHSENINKLITFKNEAVNIRQFYANYFHIRLNNGGLSKKYFLDILRYAYRLNDKNIANKYFKKAIVNRLLTFRTCIYFIGTHFPSLKRIIGNH